MSGNRRSDKAEVSELGSVATQLDVFEEVDLDFGNSRANHPLADVEAREERHGSGDFGRKKTTQHPLDYVDVRAPAIQLTLAVTLSALDQGHEDENCTARAAAG
jgi:hypothetical protein